MNNQIICPQILIVKTCNKNKVNSSYNKKSGILLLSLIFFKMKRFKSLIGGVIVMALLAVSIPMALADDPIPMAQVDFVVRGATSIGVKDAEVYVYVYNETTTAYELYSGPHITADNAGRANNVPIPIGATFFGIAYDQDDNVYADSNYTFENIWTVIDADNIQNVDTGSTRLAYVHMYPGLYEAIEPTFADPVADPDPVIDPDATGDPDTTTEDDLVWGGGYGSEIEVAVAAAVPIEVEITVYNNERDPIENVQVYAYVTDFGIYSSDTTDGAGRTNEITVPEGYEFYAIAYDEDGTTYGGTYDTYFDRENYWVAHSEAGGETIENVSTGLTRIPYLHLYPYEFIPTEGGDSTGTGAAFDADTFECGGFPDAIYADITPEECTAISYVYANGIFTGTDAGYLEWNRPINRAEVTKVMVEAFDIPEAIDPDLIRLFPDVPLTGPWYSSYIYRARQHEIVDGYLDGYFRPANTINRVELLRIFIEASGVDYSEIPTTYTFWHDITVDPEPQWFMGYANYAFFNDLLDNDGNLYPAKAMTRMDVIRLMYRASLFEA